MLKHFVVFLITAYQLTLSPDSGFLRYLGFSGGSVCMFYPSCSEYTKKMVLSRGLISGLFLGAKQLSRCHPFRKKRRFSTEAEMVYHNLK